MKPLLPTNECDLKKTRGHKKEGLYQYSKIKKADFKMLENKNYYQLQGSCEQKEEKLSNM